MRMRMICADQSLIDGPGYLMPGECHRLGRSSRCSFVLDDLSVSRVHAEMTVRDDTLVIKDLDSRNGTFFNGTKVAEVELAPGQAVSFGSALFYLLGEPEGPETSEASTHLMKASRPPKALDLTVLTDNQRRVLDLLLVGLSEKQAASKMEVKQSTVHSHVKEIHRKLGVSSRAELLALFIPELRKP
jgi:DNA-binding CsgD family transcriptional regulator